MSAMLAERDDAAEADEPWPLPEGWAFAKLGEIVERLTDGTHQPPKFESAGIPFVVIGNIKGHAIGWSSISKWVSLETYETEAKRLRPRKGDVLYTAVGSYGLAVNVADDRDFMFQRHIAFLRPYGEVIDPSYLSHALNSPLLKRQADSAARGVAQKTVTLGSLRGFILPLAPLSEQRRIDARIEELFAEIAEGEAALERVRSGLDTWRRTLLKAAVTGELTRDWRQANKPSGTASDFLTQIRALKTSRKYLAPQSTAEPYDSSLLPNIPADWLWVPLAEFINKIEAGLNVKAVGHPPHRGETGIVKISAVTWGEFDELASKTLLPGTEYDDAHIIRPGDFLISRANTLELVGAPVIVKRCERRLVLSDKVLRLRLIGQMDTWIEIFLKSPYGRQQIESFAQGNQLSMRNISQDNLRRIVVPLPPNDELRQVEKLFLELFASNEETRTQLGEIQRTEQNLRQSILKAAFEGRLVPQDPNDEPASILLARLRAEASPAPRRARGRRAAS